MSEVRLSLAQSVFDLAELRVGVGADRGDRTNADHDDQSHHDGILDSRRAVFGNEKLLHTVSKVLHVIDVL